MLEFRVCQNQKIKNSLLNISSMYIFMFFLIKVVNSFQKIKNKNSNLIRF